jgi:hypothetical protein
MISGSKAGPRPGYTEKAPRGRPRPDYSSPGQRPLPPCTVIAVGNQPPGIRDARASTL